jgi:Putative Flp pilus-assembly TadE/G-like
MTPSKREASERGAVLVHVAMALLALMAMSTFVVDSGVMWTSRRQAQNVADAAALAIAISLGHDNSADFSQNGPAYLSAKKVIESNRVWGEVPAYEIYISGYVCPPENGITGRCGKVNVFRDDSPFHRNPLPMFFGRLIGRNTQNVWATATAIAENPNATNCLRPFAIPDHYLDNSLPPNTDFDSATDLYTAPTVNSTGTGYTHTTDFGTNLVLKPGSGTQMAPGSFRFVDVVGNGPSVGGESTRGCTADAYGIGDNIGNLQPVSFPADIAKGLTSLFALDPSAVWDAASQTIVNSCVAAGSCRQYDATGDNLVNTPDAIVSPRVIALPVFNPALSASDPSSLEVVNIVGFFIESWVESPSLEIHGVVVTRPGMLIKSKGMIGSDSSLLNKIIALVR